MPSRPPKTTFYQNVENTTLWRDVSRLYEQFVGPDEEKWAEREQKFVVVLNDALVRLRENESVNRSAPPNAAKPTL